MYPKTDYAEPVTILRTWGTRKMTAILAATIAAKTISDLSDIVNPILI